MAEHITVARPYAEAVFRLAKSTGTLALWSDALGSLALVAQNEQALDVVANPKFSAAQAKTLLTDMLGATATAEVQNFLTVLLENRRFAILPAIAGLFEALKDADAGQVEAQIESAFQLDAAQVDQLIALLKSQLNRAVTASVSVNPDLIGGVKMTVGDLVIDASVRGKLAELATSLKS